MQVTMGVDAMKPSTTRGKGEADTAFGLLLEKARGPTRRRKRRPKRSRESTRQSMAADSRESRGIVLVIVGQL